LGQITGQLFSVLFAVLRFSKYDRSLLAYVSLKKMKYFARKHINFSKFIIPAQFINTIAGQAPIFILTSQFGLTEAGLLAFTNRILGVPMNFIGNAFRDVFKQRAALDYKKNGNCIDIYKKVTFTLLGISIIPFVILFITAPFLFSFFFGEEWYQAGVYARVLCVMYFISFVSMPTGWIFVIAEKQKLDFLWQIIFLIFTIVPLIIGVILKDVFMTIVFLGIGRSISYTIQLFMTYRLAKGKH
jgi:O-antigen/teichoic acid export membrane protein